jgi:hypothetical protein
MGAVWPSARARSHEHVDGQARLGVHADQRAELAGPEHRAEDLTVVE